MIYYIIIFIIILIILVFIYLFRSQNIRIQLHYKKNILNCNNKDLIPKKIFQTHKSWNYINTKPKILECIDTWRQYTDFEYNFYDDQDAEEFIKNNFENKIYQAYMSLPLPVMKADLWRYCVIYYYGGIYADTDTKCLVNPNCLIYNSLLVCAPEHDTHKLCQWFFAAPKNSPIMKKIIELCVEKILTDKNISIDSVLEITGPVIFTKGVDAYLKENNHIVTYNKIHYTQYYNNDILHIFYPADFHKNLVQHMFTGFDEDGWKSEANKKNNNYIHKLRLNFENFFNKNIKPMLNY